MLLSTILKTLALGWLGLSGQIPYTAAENPLALRLLNKADLKPARGVHKYSVSRQLASVDSPCRVLGGRKSKDTTQIRGMYVSLNTTRVGQARVEPEDQNILGDREKEDRLLEFSVRNNFNSLNIYDLSKILTTSVNKNHLTNFIDAARQCGIKDFQAIGSESEDWDRILDYQAENAGKFNGMLTEIEYWSQPSQVPERLEQFIETLQEMQTKIADRQVTADLKVSVYLGRLDRVPDVSEEEVAGQIATHIDQLFIHCYVREASRAFAVCADRLKAFAQTGKELAVFPIFSGEGDGHSAGPEVFMGEWLTKNSLSRAEAQFSEDYQEEMSAPSLQLRGFQFYEYVFLNNYVQAGNDSDQVSVASSLSCPGAMRPLALVGLVIVLWSL